MKNPLLNALAASGYIFLIASVMFYGTHDQKGPDNVMAPIVVLSVLTLSAAVMGYLFAAQPLLLYIDGKKKEAVNFFLKTLATFAGITALILALFFSGVLS